MTIEKLKMFLFSLFSFVSTEALKKQNPDIYYRSVYLANNGTEKVLDFVPMLVEKKYNSFPELHKSVLEAKKAAVSIPPREVSTRDKHYGNYDDYFFENKGSLKMNPPRISNVQLDVTKVNNFSVTIVNTDREKTVNIKNITTEANTIFIERVGPKALKPGKKLTFTFSILYKEGGQFSNLILIQTDEGKIPYYVTYSVGPVVISKASGQNFFQRVDKFDPLTISFDLGFEERCVVYDSTLFDVETATLSSFNLNLTRSKNLEPGEYTTFLYVYEFNSSYCIPLTIRIVEKGVFSSTSDIYLPAVYLQGYSMRIGTVYNALDVAIKVLNATIKDPFHGLEIASVTSNISSCSLGFNAVVALNVGKKANYSEKHSTQIIIEYVEEGSNITKNISLGLHCSIVTEDVSVNVCPPEYFEGTSIGCFFLKNLNPDPIVIFGVTAHTPFFQINEASPMLLQPNATSSNFYLSPAKDYDLFMLGTNIKVQTNVTTLYASIKSFDRSLRVLSNSSFTTYDKSNHAYNFGEIYAGARKNVTYQLLNPNLLPYTFKKIEASSGINVFYDLPQPVVVPANSSIFLNVAVEFKTAHSGTNIESLKFSGDEGYTITRVMWTSIQGSFTIQTTFKGTQIYGTREEGEVRVRSTFENSLPVSGISSNFYQIQPVCIPGNITKNYDLIVANIVIDFNSSFPLTKTFFDVIKANNSYKAQADAWDLLWDEPIKTQLEITFYIPNDQYFVRIVPFNLTYSTFPRSTIEFSTIHADEIFCKSVTLSNFFNSPLKLNFHGDHSSTRYNIKHRKSAIVMPHESYDFLVIFEGLQAGSYSLEILVTTNATPPFIIPVTANVEYPKIRFSDINKNMVTHLDFIGGEDEKYMYEKWTKCVYVTNNALTPISMNSLQITPNTFIRFRANNTNLQPYQTCSICFDFSVWLYDKEQANTEIQFSVLVQRLFYNLPIHINISDVALQHIFASVDQTMSLISIIGVTAPIVSILIALVCFFWFRRELKWRTRRVERAVKHYSVNNYQNIEVQKDEEYGSAQTQWVYRRRRNTMRATDHTIDLMEQLIH